MRAVRERERERHSMFVEKTKQSLEGESYCVFTSTTLPSTSPHHFLSINKAFCNLSDTFGIFTDLLKGIYALGVDPVKTLYASLVNPSR